MGKLEETSKELYVLSDVKVGAVTIPPKYFKLVEESTLTDEELQASPKPDGFYLDIPDRIDNVR